MVNLSTILASFFGGVILILVASKLLVEVSKELAKAWKLSPLFVSIIVVALGTNLPEFTVLISALFRGDAGLALGNVVGSNISNITLIFGAGILFHSPRIGTNKTQKNALLMATLTVVFILLEFLPILKQARGLILLGFLGTFLIYTYGISKYGRTHEDKNLLKKLQKKTKPRKSFFEIKGGVWIGFLAIIGAIIGLGMGSSSVVYSIRQLSEMFNLSTTLLGMTLVATTTSLPELMTVLIAGLKKQDKVIVGTLIGSNIYNLGLFAPIIQLSPFEAHLNPTDLIYLLISVLFFVVVIIKSKGKRVPKIYGVISLVIFGLFILSSFAG